MGCCKKKDLATEAAKVAAETSRHCSRAAKQAAHGHHGHHVKCKKAIGLVVVGLVAAAVLEELKKHPENRDWHGFIGGLIPYDFRVPTPDKIIRNLWNPEGPVVSPKTFGVGWDPNVGRIVTEAIALPDLIADEHSHNHDDDVEYEVRAS